MKGRARIGVWSLLGLVVVVATGPAERTAWAVGPGECLLQIDGVQGDSADARHRGAVDLVSWSWGVANTATISAGGAGAGAGRPEFRPLRFVHRVDRATPALFQAAASGRRVPSAVLVCRRPGPQLVEYLRITLTEVMVTGVQLSDASDGPPSADVTLAYARVAIEYHPQMPDGTVGQPVGGAWDLRLNRQ